MYNCSYSRFKIYDLQFLSDEKQHRINIQGPEIGSWFAVAFVSWTDPNNERIEQQGNTQYSVCETKLYCPPPISARSLFLITLSAGEPPHCMCLTSVFYNAHRQAD